ncbi:hypothetical protein [Neobacillus sp. PS3-40]
MITIAFSSLIVAILSFSKK